MHIDWPIEAVVNPYLEEVKELYKNSQELVRINKKYRNGKVESEYYPDIKVWNNG